MVRLVSSAYTQDSRGDSSEAVQNWLMTSPHPTASTAQPPDRSSFAGRLMLQVAAGMEEMDRLQWKVVDWVESGGRAERADGDLGDLGDLGEAGEAGEVGDADDALLLLEDLVRAHDAAVGERSEDTVALLQAFGELQGEHGILAVSSDMDRRGAHAAGEALSCVVPDVRGWLTLEQTAVEEAVLTGRLVLGTAGPVVDTALAVLCAHGLAAAVLSTPDGDDAVVLDGFVYASPRDDAGALAAVHMRGPRFEVVQTSGVSSATFLSLLTGRPGTSASAAVAPVRVWNGFGWLLEADGDTLRFRHLRSPWSYTAPLGGDGETGELVDALIAGDIRKLRAHPWERSHSQQPSRAPGSARHPSSGTVYPPDRRTLPGSMMLMVASGISRSYDDLQAEALLLADGHGVLTPEEALLLLDDVLTLHDEAVGTFSTDFFRAMTAFQSVHDHGLAMGLPAGRSTTARESADQVVDLVPGAVGRAWAERRSFEQAVLTGSLPVAVGGADPIKDSTDAAALAADVFRDGGLDVRWDGSAHSRVVLEPLDWALTHDAGEELTLRRVWGPGTGMLADEQVTPESVLAAVHSIDGRRGPAHRRVEVWTGQGWQLEVERSVVRLTHVRSPRVHTRRRPSPNVLGEWIDAFLAGRIADLLAHDWEVSTPGIVAKRRKGGRGPATRMHPAFSTAHPPGDGSLEGTLMLDVAIGVHDVSTLSTEAAERAGSTDEADSTEEQGTSLVDDLIRLHDEVVEGADSSVGPIMAAFAALEKRGILVVLGAADVQYGHDQGIERVGALIAEDPGATVRGYVFSHDQDLARAVQDGELLIGFGAVPATRSADAAIAAEAVAALRAQGLDVEWDGHAGSRITVDHVVWAAPAGGGADDVQTWLRGCSDDEHDGADQSRVRTVWLTDRWGSESDGAAASDATGIVQAFAVLYGALFDEAYADDAEHTVVAVTDSDGWALEFGQASASLENVEANAPAPSLRGALTDRAEALALVETFLSGGAEAVRAGLRAQS